MLGPFVGLTLIIIKFPSAPSTIHLAFLCGNQRAPRKAGQMMPQANLREVEVWSGLFIVPGSVLSQDITTHIPDGDDEEIVKKDGSCQLALSSSPLIWRCLSCCSFPITSISLRSSLPPRDFTLFFHLFLHFAWHSVLASIQSVKQPLLLALKEWPRVGDEPCCSTLLQCFVVSQTFVLIQASYYNFSKSR